MATLKQLQKNIKVGDKLICLYFNSNNNAFYGSFFTVIVTEIGTDNYKPIRDFVGQKDDGTFVTLWRKEIKGNVA